MIKWNSQIICKSIGNDGGPTDSLIGSIFNTLYKQTKKSPLPHITRDSQRDDVAAYTTQEMTPWRSAWSVSPRSRLEKIAITIDHENWSRYCLGEGGRLWRRRGALGRQDNHPEAGKVTRVTWGYILTHRRSNNHRKNTANLLSQERLTRPPQEGLGTEDFVQLHTPCPSTVGHYTSNYLLTA